MDEQPDRKRSLVSKGAHIEEYQIASDRFSKEYLQDGQVRFLKNGHQLDLAAWNREINRVQSMSLKRHHPNPLIRWKETHRQNGFLRMVDAQPGEIVADVGCESGYIAQGLVERDCHVICVDIDPHLLQLARQRLGPDRAVYLVSDIRAIQLPDASVDVAIGSEILEHLPDPHAGLRELIRITRPGGHIFLSVPNEVFVLSIKRALRALHLTHLLGPLQEDLAVGHVKIFRRRDLVQLCRIDGVTVKRVFYHLPFFLNIFAFLERKRQ